MKSFFEEYGFVILAAVVVIALIAMTDPISEAIEGSMTDIVDGFTTQVSTDLGITS